jgi:hypothetical protein
LFPGEAHRRYRLTVLCRGLAAAHFRRHHPAVFAAHGLPEPLRIAGAGSAVLLLWIHRVMRAVVRLWSASQRVVVCDRPRRRSLSGPKARQSGIASGVSIHWRFWGRCIRWPRTRTAAIGTGPVEGVADGSGAWRLPGEVGGRWPACARRVQDPLRSSRRHWSVASRPVCGQEGRARAPSARVAPACRGGTDALPPQTPTSARWRRLAPRAGAMRERRKAAPFPHRQCKGCVAIKLW